MVQSILVLSQMRVEKEGVLTKNSELKFCARLLSSGCSGPGGLKQQVCLILLKFLVVILFLTMLLVVSLPACSRGGRFFQRRHPGGRFVLMGLILQVYRFLRFTGEVVSGCSSSRSSRADALDVHPSMQ